MATNDDLEYLQLILSSPPPSCYAQSIIDEITLFDVALEKIALGLSISDDQSVDFYEQMKENEIVHNVNGEVKPRVEEGNCLMKDVGSTMHVELSELDKYVGLHACVDAAKWLPSTCPILSYVMPSKLQNRPMFYYMEPAKATWLAQEADACMIYGEHMHRVVMLGANDLPFDPGGGEFFTLEMVNRGILHLPLRCPCFKPWHPGGTLYAQCITWRLFFKQWDPGGSP